MNHDTPSSSNNSDSGNSHETEPLLPTMSEDKPVVVEQPVVRDLPAQSGQLSLSERWPRFQVIFACLLQWLVVGALLDLFTSRPNVANSQLVEKYGVGKLAEMYLAQDASSVAALQWGLRQGVHPEKEYAVSDYQNHWTFGHASMAPYLGEAITVESCTIDSANRCWIKAYENIVGFEVTLAENMDTLKGWWEARMSTTADRALVFTAKAPSVSAPLNVTFYKISEKR